jgi:hypothetical protein
MKTFIKSVLIFSAMLLITQPVVFSQGKNKYSPYVK